MIYFNLFYFIIWPPSLLLILCRRLQPKFLTKDERMKEALARRQAQVTTQKKALEVDHKNQMEYLKKAKDSAGKW